MKNFKFTMQYDGTRYNGWQRQGNTADTIQGKLEAVLCEWMGHAVEIHGAGRTDAGVHARAQVAHCKLNTAVTAKEMLQYCNRYLPADIAVVDCQIVEERFHARLNAQAKRYIYRLWTGEIPNVFERKYVCAWDKPFSLEKAQHAAKLLEGKHDFRAFSTGHTKKSTERVLTRIEIQQKQAEIDFVFEGTGFLHHMVRIMTGTIAEIAAGERSEQSILQAFTTTNRTDAGRTMPPHGLILDKVFYEDRITD